MFTTIRIPVHMANLNPDMATVYICELLICILMANSAVSVSILFLTVFSKHKDSFKKSQSLSLEDTIKLLLVQYKKSNYNFFPKTSYLVILLNTTYASLVSRARPFTNC